MKPDPKLIDSMSMRYRHDFGFLDQTQKDSIRTTMTQLWEEVVGLGFYKVEKTITPNPKLKSIMKYVVKTYLDDGRIFKYEVDSAEKVFVNTHLLSSRTDTDTMMGKYLNTTHRIGF